ncbi:coronin-7 isoform X3 [Anopheles arabiensis]|uniref:coronin-7 isoform X3 n=1 Tax=Anopheles arabiensis TaxID=7173 RepID=UPI001AAD142F|nr:coronin-7 isoform X3 [Anopheles arabiensis]
MAWRFKASKYKNAAPIVPKPEACIRDIFVGSYQTYGNNIAASAAFIAFNWEHAGSSLAVLPIDDCGRKSKTMPLLHAHSDTVTYLDFSPFHDGLLATGSQDCLVKVWHIPEKGLEQSLSTPECTFTTKQRRVETVGFHPTADCLLYATAVGWVSLWDLTTQQEAFSNNEHPEVIQSLSWKQDGRLCVTSCKDKMVRVLDPRASAPITLAAESHQSIKDSRVVWLGEQNRILSTGFDAARLRQVIIRDLRNFSVPEKTLELDCSTGILMPLYDPDTNMLFLSGKGDTTINYLEVTDKDPYLIEGIRHSGEQTKGACLVPKRALKVMEGEVNRIMQLTSNSVIPIMYQVPRKTYRDFHNDLYPDTNGYKSEMTATQWLNGANTPVPKISLDPAKREHGDAPIIPRLGPKPFCSTGSSGDFSFEKVFNVPAVPGAEPGSDKESAALPGPTVGGSSAPAEKNGNTLTVSPEPDEPKDDSPTEPGKPEPAEPMDQCDVETRTIPHAELRKPGEQEKIFERQASSESVDQFDATADDAKGQFERLSAQRTSLAERRRMFESRSQSVQDGEKASSPTPLRRRESLKVRGEQKSCTDDTDLMPPPPATDFLRNRSDLSKENMPDIVKRSNSTAGVSTVASSNNASANNNNNNVASKRTSTVFGRVSKFRHLKGTPGHKSTHIENIRNLSRQIPGECDGFAANAARVAVPIAGAGGKIAVLELNDPGRLPDGVIPTLVNIQNIMDFQWDPFDASRLAVACDDGSVKLWRIPAGGLTEPTNEPEAVLVAHADKLYTLRFHPLAQNVLLTASVDMVMKVWDLGTMEEKCTLHGHTDQIFCFSWSPCGRYGATVSKDGRIRVYEPRQSSQPIGEGTGPVGTRGARVLWALEGDYLVVTGFDKVSERQIYVYKVADLSAPMGMVGLDVSPAILMPYYDEDSSTLFATGKGDSTIYCFEITDEAPFICPLSHHRCTNLTQGLSFLAKNQCDVAAVEFARALRLTNGTVEPLSFTVPRLKVELFQDDLFPPTRVLWQPTLTAAEWFAGRDVAPARISMKPDGMDTLSSIQPTVTTTPSKKSDTVLMTQGIHKPFAKAPEHVQEQIKNAVSARMSVNKKLEQDSMEGVDEKEWEE